MNNKKIATIIKDFALKNDAVLVANPWSGDVLHPDVKSAIKEAEKRVKVNW